MKAVRLWGKADLRVEEVPEPAVSPGEVLVAVKASLICGTDIRMLQTGGHAHGGSGPRILGHEVSGIIAKPGKGVSGDYAEGARVAVAPNIGCGICDWCVGGDTHMCGSLRAIGINLDGAFAEYVRIPADAVSQGNLALIPGDMTFEEAALAEPLSCVYSAFERCRTRPGDTVLVIGAGPIGLLHAKLHRLSGAGLVMVHDLNEERLAFCGREDPALAVIGPDRPVERVMDLTRGKGADVVITAAPSPEAQVLSFDVVAANGRVVFFGGLPKDKEIVGLNTNAIHYRQITVTGTTRQNLRQYRACLDLLGKKLIDVKRIITHRFALDQAAEAFENVRSGKGLKSGFVP